MRTFAVRLALPIALATAGLAQAQTAPALAQSAAPVAAPVTGAPLSDAAVGLRPAAPPAFDAAAEARAAAPRRRGYGRSVALMGTGAAAVVIGLVAGGDAGGVLVFGGAVVGLVGLYQYLQ